MASLTIRNGFCEAMDMERRLFTIARGAIALVAEAEQPWDRVCDDGVQSATLVMLHSGLSVTLDCPYEPLRDWLVKEL